MKYLPNILLIAGTGKKVGKTTLGCNILSSHTDKGIIAVKISPHFHSMPTDRVYIIKNNRYHISEENKKTGKDSSKFLQAGAKKVYYIQGKDDSLATAFEEVLGLNDSTSLYLVESGGLAGYIKPGLFIAVTNSNHSAKPDKNLSLADILVDENIAFGPFAKRVCVNGGKWALTRT